MNQLKIPAAWMRGGTSKGLFFRADVLPADPALANRILLRAVGSPDPYGKQSDGVGGGTSATSKIAIVGKSTQEGCDVDYLFGHVAIDDALIDYAGNCGNLTAAVGPFAIEERLVPAVEGMTTVRIWQANVGKVIVAHVPVKHGLPVVESDFRFDGLAFPGAEIRLDFLDPAGGSTGKLFPTGNKIDTLDIPDLGKLKTTLIDAGNPTVFVKAKDLGLSGFETPDQVNANAELLARLETIRAHAAVAMGLAETPDEATRLRPAIPKISFVAKPADYVAAGGRPVAKADCDITARIVSMGKLHHAYTGTGAIALAVAACIPATIVSQTVGKALEAGRELRFGQPAGVTTMAAEVEGKGSDWNVPKVSMGRSARRLMEGCVLVPMPAELAVKLPEPVSTEPVIWAESKPEKRKAKPKQKPKEAAPPRAKQADKAARKPKPEPLESAAETQPAAAEPLAVEGDALAVPDAQAVDKDKPSKPRRRRRRKPKAAAEAAE
ncbi:2-methylaconitate cis-trans isomerase PrpF [Chitinivorax sp. PXF-14]|uniref:2-methylaconitate cis-trans isomerase PrpF n=1 Tax=Chitinivorax sp. PXF-14 TaxID=3230488 RepID=UPI003466B084